MTTFLTSQQMQELINVDRSTVYRMAEDGRLPGVKIGRQWRFPADQVAEQLGLSSVNGSTPATVQAAPAADDTASRATTTSRSTPPGLPELLVPEVAQSVADLMGDLFGVMAVITDMHGQPLTAVANPCGYYAAIANQPGAAEACLAEWRHFADEPHVAPRFVRTHLGFLCARTFVWVDLKPVGMIVVGGVTPPAWPPSREHLDGIAAEVGVRAEMLHDAVDQTWDVDVEQQRRILQLLPQMGDLISQLATARSQLAATTTTITTAITTTPHPPTVPQGGD
jgi:excisionase family DNA binding protein